MNKDLRDILYTLPPGVDYTEDLCALDEQDFPVDRIPKLLSLIQGDDPQVAFRAALILCSWGNEEGFEYMRRFVLRDPPQDEGWYPHHLRSYDDTYRFALDALDGYRARKADISVEAGQHAREEIFKPVTHIINLSSSMPFAINSLFYLLEIKGFTEYIPALKAHLQAIIKVPEKHHWKIADCVHLLAKFDPDFVTQTLAAHGYTLADFPSK
ncbi:UNVERIFIED_ORG: hypothetical protein LHJ69_13055 [Shinella sp. XGS7]|nr:hypothetical protein [Shinella sp. XGS7]